MQPPSKPKSRAKQVLKYLVVSYIALMIFGLGVLVGNGTIDFNSRQGNRPNVANQNLPNRLNYNEVNQVYQALKKNYDGKLTVEQMENGLKHGLATSTGDPYTSFFTAREAQEFQEQLNSSFSGIGAQLGQDKEDNIEIIAPIDGFPAQKAGLKAKDIIAEINGQTTSGMSVDSAVSKIRGKPGTTVKLKVIRGSETLEFSIVRQQIDLPSVESKKLDDNTGYIKISNFAEDTTDLTLKAAQEFKQAGVKGIVLDLRNNPGGLLDQSVNVSNFWLKPGKVILQEKRGGEVKKTYRSATTGSMPSGGLLAGIKTVVLTNGGSASASEIVAGALNDNEAAYLIGEKTYGKGSVQELIGFEDNSQLKVTVASWYRPNGQNINKKGINPDQTVKPSEADSEAGRDVQLEAAQQYLSR